MKAVVRSLDELDQFSANAAKSGKFAGKPLTVTLVPLYTPRSSDQNSKMHVMFRELADHLDHIEGDVKSYFKLLFGPTISMNLQFGPHKSGVQIPKGTADYSVGESNAMIKHLYRVGGGCGCVFSEGENHE